MPSFKTSLPFAIVMVGFCVAAMRSVTAEHLKVHMASHHHAKMDITIDTENSEPAKYLRENNQSIYAICVFRHNGWLWNNYSIAFFDSAGGVIEEYCNEHHDLPFEILAEVAHDMNDWTNEEIDEQSKCYLYKTEETNAVLLMGSYRCRD